MFKRFPLTTHRREHRATEKNKNQGEKESDAKRNERSVQDQSVGLRHIVCAQRATDGRRNAAPHGAGRQHLLQHDHWEHQGHASKREETQLAHIPSFSDGHQRAGGHGKNIR